MFDKDFYPTPVEVIRQMLEGIKIDGRVMLDPESGKADILRFCKRRGAKTYGCEINDQLHKLSAEHAKMIGTDFLDVDRVTVSHIDLIVMNPPFSKDIEHILHAWNIAPAGCEIRALCNLSTINTGVKKVQELSAIMNGEGNGSLKDLGSCFVDAERTTKVEVALISLTKPAKEEEDFSEYFETENIDEEQEYGVMKPDAIVEIVGRYVGAIKMFKNVDELSGQINAMMSPINQFSIAFGCTKYDRNRGNTEHLSYADFKIDLQKSAWQTVFSKMKMDKYMTESLKEKINKFVEQQSEVPFTVQNIYNMLQFIFDGHSGRMDEVLIEVFEKLTKHYDDNRYAVEGWKTNSHYMINQKVIVPYMTGHRFGGGMEMAYNGNKEKIDDLVKALCYITGENYDDYQCLDSWCSRVKITDPEYYRNNEDIIHSAKKRYRNFLNDYRTTDEMKAKWTEESYVENAINFAIERKELTYRREFGKWYDWGFFEVKGFKKGTMHFKFKDKKVWELFNRKVAEAKGYELPENL